MSFNRFLCFTCLILACAPMAKAQNSSLSLKEAIQLAEKNYPLLKAKLLEVEAAKQNVTLTKHTTRPTLDVSYQADLATYNNITGLYNPQGILAISGPPSLSNNFAPVLGSAAALLFNWQPITFGRLESQMKIAQSSVEIKIAESKNEIFQHQIKVVSAYLDLSLAQETLILNQQNLQRTLSNLKQSKALVAAGLRPAVDTALFGSEISAAKIEILRTRQYLQNQKLVLSELLASDTSFILTDTVFIKKASYNTPIASASSSSHPLIELSESNIEVIQRSIGGQI